MRNLIKYDIPYTHTVVVGIESDTTEQAIEIARAKFEDGTLWDDTSECPLICDDFFEGESEDGVLFSVDTVVEGDWPNAEASVIELRAANSAALACRLLVEVYEKAITNEFTVTMETLAHIYNVARRARDLTT